MNIISPEHNPVIMARDTKYAARILRIPVTRLRKQIAHMQTAQVQRWGVTTSCTLPCKSKNLGIGFGFMFIQCLIRPLWQEKWCMVNS